MAGAAAADIAALRTGEEASKKKTMARAKNKVCVAASASMEKDLAGATNTMCVAGPVPRRLGASPMVCVTTRDELLYSNSFDAQCNEVIEGLCPSESPCDCPDIIHRVYHRKRKEHYPNAPKGASKRYQRKPEKLGATMDFPLASHQTGIRIKLGKVKVTQLPVNCNIATTGH